MAIPDFQTIMRPFLQFISNGSSYHIKEIAEGLADVFNLTDTERKEIYANSRQPVFNNRVAWAKSYLLTYKLLTSPQRAHVVISQTGINLLNSYPGKLSIAYLKGMDDAAPGQVANQVSSEVPENLTPEDQMGVAYNSLTEQLVSDLIERVLQLTPSQFERLVVDLIVRMGYGGSFQEAGKAIGKSGDEGIDGVISEDRLGLDKIYIQAKQWATTQSVKSRDIRDFGGALAQKGARKGVFITTTRFTSNARRYDAPNFNIVLIDGKELAELMIEYNIGVSIQCSYDIKKVDLDYFDGV
jgi:restriction system protein